MAKEVEIKFQIADRQALIRALRRTGFKQVTPSTHEMNVLYDLPGQKLRVRGELLRLRKYGDTWVLTHKSKGKSGRHKVRAELETRLENGKEMDLILRALGYAPAFRYEKYRSEWSDGVGHAVLDETPIGTFGELEGPARWIDQRARSLGVAASDYITRAYTDLFFAWKRGARSTAKEMTFKAVGSKGRKPTL